jgi:hypothetical protein
VSDEEVIASGVAAGGSEATEATEGDVASAPAEPPAGSGEPASDQVPAEPIAAEAVAPFSAEAEKAKEDFAKEPPMADEVESATVPEDAADTPQAAAAAVEDETPAEHLMEHNADLEPTDDDARDEEADELRHEREDDRPDQV